VDESVSQSEGTSLCEQCSLLSRNLKFDEHRIAIQDCVSMVPMLNSWLF
jgi:hypothetical protein